MTHEEKLDNILKTLIVHRGSMQAEEFPNVNMVEFKDHISELKKRGYITDRGFANIFYLTPLGEMFYTQGGFVGEENRKTRSRYVSERTLIWTIIAAVAAIVAAVVGIIQFLKL